LNVVTSLNSWNVLRRHCLNLCVLDMCESVHYKTHFRLLEWIVRWCMLLEFTVIYRVCTLFI
jgi:hypothetical protein